MKNEKQWNSYVEKNITDYGGACVKVAKGTKWHKVSEGDILEVSETHWSGESTNHIYYKVQADMPHPVKIDYAEVTRSFM